MTNHHDLKLKPYLSPVGAWAFSLGTSIGWGSLVITSSTYLSQAGPLGSVLGLLIGTIIMLVISRSYRYLMVRYPGTGGAYSFAKHIFGYDIGFLTAWFLALTYFSILWANITSLPLFARYFVGDIFKFCKLYSIYGYDIYLGEALLSIGAVILTTLLCVFSKKIAARLMTGLAFLFVGGIVVCFVAAIFGLDVPMSPALIPEKSAITQVVKIACISTWAFIGFENISHFTEEFAFPRKQIMPVLRTAVLSSAALYFCVTLLSVTAYPPEYSSWLEYIGDLSNLEGIKGLPAFYAAQHYLGDAGIIILMLALLALVITSLIGNTTALSRLLFSMSKDNVLPQSMSSLNKRSIPWKTIVFIGIISSLIPFIGRVAIGWIVDVTTLGAAMIYGIVAAAAYKIAKEDCDTAQKRFSLLGLILMVGIGLYLLLPNLFWEASLEKETYFLFVIWSVLGLIFFRVVLKRDTAGRFGHSILVWVALLSVTLFISLVWMNQSMLETASDSLETIRNYYSRLGGLPGDPVVIAKEYAEIKSSNSFSLGVIVALFAIAVGLLINNYTLMSRRAKKSEAELGVVRDVAFTDSLTGVKSKHAYIEHESELNRAIESGETEVFAITVCDLNDLKYINDNFGHKCGDRYIRRASALICEIFKHSPVYRIGGDEFVVIMHGHDYEQREEHLRAFAEHNRAAKPGEDPVIAVGMSEFIPGRDVKVANVFERADAMMYENKKSLKSARD